MQETTAIRHSSRGGPRRVLILVENLPSPFDHRVWQEACALRDTGYVVSELEWRHEAPKLLAAYEVLWHTARVSPAARGL